MPQMADGQPVVDRGNNPRTLDSRSRGRVRASSSLRDNQKGGLVRSHGRRFYQRTHAHSRHIQGISHGRDGDAIEFLS